MTSKVSSSSKNEFVSATKDRESKIYRWTGVSDCADAYAAYQKKEYSAAWKSSKLATMKIGAIGVALFGIYKGYQVVENSYSPIQSNFRNLKNAVKGHPTSKKSIDSYISQMTMPLYEKYEKFSEWPSEIQEFFLSQIGQETVVAGRIVKKLCQDWGAYRDGSLRKKLHEICSKISNSSQIASCLNYDVERDESGAPINESYVFLCLGRAPWSATDF